MPLVFRPLHNVAARLSRRLATKASRFQFAVSLGFAVALVGVASVGLDRAGFADGLFDLFGGGSIFGGEPQAQQPYAVKGRAAWAERRHRRHVARLRDVSPPRVARVKAGGSDHATGGSFDVGSHSMCVRLCDGYAFPVGTYHGEADRASHEATCHAECPGAETALYVMPAGSDSIADAVRVNSGRNYSQLPDAFHYTSVLDGACTCHPPKGNRIKSLLHDFTLRRGDAVMTQTGFKIFHGAARFPYNRRDFVALARSRDIRGPDRATFKAIERASLVGRTDIAQKAPTPATPSPLASQSGTRALEHQASRVDWRALKGGGSTAKPALSSQPRSRAAPA